MKQLIINKDFFVKNQKIYLIKHYWPVNVNIFGLCDWSWHSVIKQSFPCNLQFGQLFCACLCYFEMCLRLEQYQAGHSQRHSVSVLRVCGNALWKSLGPNQRTLIFFQSALYLGPSHPLWKNNLNCVKKVHRHF